MSRRQKFSPNPPLIDLTNCDEFGAIEPEDLAEAERVLPEMMETFVKQEPVLEPEPDVESPAPEAEPEAIVMQPSSSSDSNVPIEVVVRRKSLLEARKLYDGRFYRSNLLYSDLENPDKCNSWVITSSTLSGLSSNERVPGLKNIIAVEAPGATLAGMIKPALTELAGIRDISSPKILICGGVNNFLRNHSYMSAYFEATLIKRKIKELIPSAQVSFVKIPIIPKLCKLPEDTHEVVNDRTFDILNLNEAFGTGLSDSHHDISLQPIGVKSISLGCKMWSVYDNDRNPKLVMTGRSHIMAQSRESEPTEAVHIKTPIRKVFWSQHIVPFFN